MDGVRHGHADGGSVVTWRPIEGDRVYVAKLGDPRPGSGAKTWSPGTKKIKLVAQEIVIFDDLTHLPIGKFFPLTDVGRKACEDWCQQIELMEECRVGIERQFFSSNNRS